MRGKALARGNAQRRTIDPYMRYISLFIPLCPCMCPAGVCLQGAAAFRADLCTSMLSKLNIRDRACRPQTCTLQVRPLNSQDAPCTPQRGYMVLDLGYIEVDGGSMFWKASEELFLKLRMPKSQPQVQRLAVW